MGTGESWGLTSDGLVSCPGGPEIFSVILVPMKPDINTDLMSHIGSEQTLLLLFFQRPWVLMLDPTAFSQFT